MKILITGSTGTLGNALIKKLYGKHDLYSLSRDEYKAFNLKLKYPKINKRFRLNKYFDFPSMFSFLTDLYLRRHFPLLGCTLNRSI